MIPHLEEAQSLLEEVVGDMLAFLDGDPAYNAHMEKVGEDLQWVESYDKLVRKLLAEHPVWGRCLLLCDLLAAIASTLADDPCHQPQRKQLGVLAAFATWPGKEIP